MDFHTENVTPFNADIYLVLYQYSTGNFYFAPMWDTVPGPVISDYLMPSNKTIKDIHLLDIIIPQQNPPIDIRGKYLFAVGVSPTGTLYFWDDFGKAEFSYSVEDQPYKFEYRTIDGIDFIYLPPGSFKMGSYDGTKDEKPIHEVTITKGFWLSTYEITQRQWQNVMQSNPSLYKSPAGYRSNTTNNPVEQVSWNDVQEFISAMGSDKYRLPTEAEWEYACRAGITSSESYGTEYPPTFYSHYRDMPDPLELPFGSKPVGKYTTYYESVDRANPWGFYDMIGNVYEWCQDWYGENYYAESPAIDPKGPTNGTARVLRGGAFCYYSPSTRSADRFKLEPDKSFFFIGFRLVRDE